MKNGSWGIQGDNMKKRRRQSATSLVGFRGFDSFAFLGEVPRFGLRADIPGLGCRACTSESGDWPKPGAPSPKRPKPESFSAPRSYFPVFSVYFSID